MDWTIFPSGSYQTSPSKRGAPPSVPKPQYALPAIEKLPIVFLINNTEVGYSSKVPFMSLEDRAALGANVEKVLLKEKDAARAPIP
jgi:DOPA 4,5-dioxygenase